MKLRVVRGFFYLMDCLGLSIYRHLHVCVELKKTVMGNYKA